MYCISCQYDLRKLTDNRCPECDREFDPSDSATFDSSPPLNWMRMMCRALLLIAVSYIVSYGFIYRYLLAYNELVEVQWTQSRMLRESFIGGIYALPIAIPLVWIIYAALRFFYTRFFNRPEAVSDL